MTPELRRVVVPEFLLQRIQPSRPELPHMNQPILKFKKTSLIELVEPVLPFNTDLHQLRFFQEFQVLRDGWRANLEPLCDGARRHLSLRQQFDDLPACRIRKSGQAQHVSHYFQFCLIKSILN